MGFILFLLILLVLAILCFKAALSMPTYPLFVATDKNHNIFYFILKDEKFIIAQDDKANKIVYEASIQDPSFSFEIQEAYTPAEYEQITKDKSVIGRAIVGGLLLGPVGAIVGGMSGIGTKTKTKQVKKELRETFAIVNGDIDNLYKIMNIQVPQALKFQKEFKYLRNSAK